MSIELKIKSKHLSVESKIIRQEELKLKKQAQWLRDHQESDVGIQKARESLAQHRQWDVRNEQRATYLARAFIQGKPYSEVEQKCNDIHKRTYYIQPRVLKMIAKYGTTVSSEELKGWFKT